MRSASFLCRCIVLFLLLSPGCRERHEKPVQRYFYFWRSVYDPSEKEKEAVDKLAVRGLFTRFFDVDWDPAAGLPRPVALIRFAQKPNLPVTPVVFITNETIKNIEGTAIDTLAANIGKLLVKITAHASLRLSNEIQLDCDWTRTTRDSYFRLLNKLREQPVFSGKILSVTIRLHQVKFHHQTGIPPADKGMLMCYNMGNLRDPAVRNSILDTRELKKSVSP